MISLIDCTIFSDGSVVFVPKSNFSSSSTYKFLTKDILNNSYWSGMSSEHKTEVAVFISRLNLQKDK